MKSTAAILSLLLGAALPALADIQTDWAYHAVGTETAAAETVPGGNLPFFDGGEGPRADRDTVTIHVLTARDFAGDLEEQIFVRWWDGTASHWIMGTRVRGLSLDAARPDGVFRGQPAAGTAALDLWRIEIPPGITQPGDNFYAIQLKGLGPDFSEERYLLRGAGGDFSRTNNLGQIWSASEEFDGQDWKVEILP